MMTYQEQIKHPRWQKKRLEVLKLHKFRCQTCGEKEEELHVHHPVYKRGAMIWEYDKKELECLCHRCHKDAHAIDEKIKKALAICKNKDAVLAFIVELNKPTILSAVVPKPKQPSPYELARQRKEEEEDAEIARDDAVFFAKYPHLAPHPDDTDGDRADKFFARMKIIMG